MDPLKNTKNIEWLLADRSWDSRAKERLTDAINLLLATDQTWTVELLSRSAADLSPVLELPWTP